MARGGRRTGVQGRNYANRTDLSMNARPLPVMTATNQPYGVAGAQADAQRAVPLAPPPGAAVAAGPDAGATARVEPGSLGSLDRPSTRPMEPITAGAPVGAGAGTEVLGLGQSNPTASLVGSLETMARISGSKDIAELAMRAQQIKDF